MPYGLTNAPAVFQSLMNQLLIGLSPPVEPDDVGVYIDDIIVFSCTLEGHLQHLCRKLQRIKGGGLKLKYAKCQFVCGELNTWVAGSHHKA